MRTQRQIPVAGKRGRRRFPRQGGRGGLRAPRSGTPDRALRGDRPPRRRQGRLGPRRTDTLGPPQVPPCPLAPGAGFPSPGAAWTVGQPVNRGGTGPQQMPETTRPPAQVCWELWERSGEGLPTKSEDGPTAQYHRGSRPGHGF